MRAKIGPTTSWTSLRTPADTGAHSLHIVHSFQPPAGQSLELIIFSALLLFWENKCLSKSLLERMFHVRTMCGHVCSSTLLKHCFLSCCFFGTWMAHGPFVKTTKRGPMLSAHDYTNMKCKSGLQNPHLYYMKTNPCFIWISVLISCSKGESLISYP